MFVVLLLLPLLVLPEGGGVEGSRADSVLDCDLVLINGHDLELYSDSLSTLTATIEGSGGTVACESLAATSDTLDVVAGVTRWAADKKIILEATPDLGTGRILELWLGDNPQGTGDTLGTDTLPQIPVRIWHAGKNDTGQTYGVHIRTYSAYEDCGSGLVVHNYGRSDGVTVSTNDGQNGSGCGIGVINTDDNRASYGISMGNNTGRAIVIGQAGTGEAIEIRRIEEGAKRAYSDTRWPRRAHILVFNASYPDHPDGHMRALYADAADSTASDSLQLQFTQWDSTVETEHSRFEIQVDGDTWTDGSVTAQGKVQGSSLETFGPLALQGFMGRYWTLRSVGSNLEVAGDSSTTGSRTMVVKAGPEAKAKLEVHGSLVVGSEEGNATISGHGQLSFSGKGGLVLPVKDVKPDTTKGTQYEAVLDTAEARIYVNWNGDKQWKFVELSNP
jgi:hypothetical protein